MKFLNDRNVTTSKLYTLYTCMHQGCIYRQWGEGKGFHIEQSGGEITVHTSFKNHEIYEISTFFVILLL